MKTLALLTTAAALLLAGCGDDGATPQPNAGSAGTPDAVMTKDAGGGAVATDDQDATMVEDGEDAATVKDGEDAAIDKDGTEIVLGDSEFGDMLFDSKKQAIYVFEIDKPGESVCYDECAEAWPPVFTKGDPVARRGVDASLLGTTKRRDGKLQVTYKGKPLYYYAHEGPNEVKCHNINLNGGLWWVVGADGERLQ